MAVAKAPKPAPQDGRRVDPAINSYAQWRLERWLKENPTKLATDLASEFGLSNFVVSTVKNKGEGVGWFVARQLAKAFGLTLAEFVAEADRHYAKRRAHEEHRLRDLPEWTAALSEAVALGIPRAEAEAVGEWRAGITGRLTGETIANLATAARGATIPKKPTRRR